MSSELIPLKQQNLTAILSALAAVSQVRVAERTGISETAICRMKDKDLEQFALVLAACNLTVMPRTYSAIDPDELRAMQILARKALAGAGFGA